MNKIFITAEAGVNHNGSIDIASKLIEQAALSGADAVKFQTFNSSYLLVQQAPKARYQLTTTNPNRSQLEMLKSLELSEEMHIYIFEYCKKLNITFLSTPFDIASADFLFKLGLKTFKIPSGEITNIPYLRKIGSFRKKIILSTGMSTLGEIETALDVLENTGTPRSNVTLLHCTTEYPAPMDEVNLNAIITLRHAFPGIAGVGYSDHTRGIHISIAAAALGACVIEKHFTLDRNMEGPDHKASLEPNELKDMVACIRDIEKAMGDGIKRPTPSELPNIAVARKSLVAAQDIRKGEIFTPENMTTKRPGTGVSPMRWDEFLGKKAKRDYKADELL